MCKWHEQRKTPYRIEGLSYKDVKRSGKAQKFHGKAAQSRHLVPLVLELCREQNDGSEHAQYKLACAGALCGLYEVMDNSGRKLYQDTLKRFSGLGTNFVLFMLLCIRVVAVIRGSTRRTCTWSPTSWMSWRRGGATHGSIGVMGTRTL